MYLYLIPSPGFGTRETSVPCNPRLLSPLLFLRVLSSPQSACYARYSFTFLSSSPTHAFAFHLRLRTPLRLWIFSELTPTLRRIASSATMGLPGRPRSCKLSVPSASHAYSLVCACLMHNLRAPSRAGADLSRGRRTPDVGGAQVSRPTDTRNTND